MDPRQRAHASVPAAPRAKAEIVHGYSCLVATACHGCTPRVRSTDSFTIAAYDHSVQAGSSVDCFKHIVLICLLQRMVRDGDPFLLIDTHAGRGKGTLHGLALVRHTAKAGSDPARSLRPHSGGAHAQERLQMGSSDSSLQELLLTAMQATRLLEEPSSSKATGRSCICLRCSFGCFRLHTAWLLPPQQKNSREILPGQQVAVAGNL